MKLQIALNALYAETNTLPSRSIRIFNGTLTESQVLVRGMHQLTTYDESLRLLEWLSGKVSGFETVWCRSRDGRTEVSDAYWLVTFKTMEEKLLFKLMWKQ